MLGWSAAGPLIPHECTTVDIPPRPRFSHNLQETKQNKDNTSTQPIPTELTKMLTHLPVYTERPEGVLLNADDREAILHLYKETRLLPNGHYQAPVLWVGAARPPNNRHAAIAEWNRNLTRLKDANLHGEFDKIIKHWLQSGYIERLQTEQFRINMRSTCPISLY